MPTQEPLDITRYDAQDSNQSRGQTRHLRRSLATPRCWRRRSALGISGFDDEGEIRVIELLHHPFFLGTLFVPQLRSTPTSPHPLVTAFLQAVVGVTA